MIKFRSEVNKIQLSQSEILELAKYHFERMKRFINGCNHSSKDHFEDILGECENYIERINFLIETYKKNKIKDIEFDSQENKNE